MAEGLIPLNQRSMCSTGDVAYHEFEGPALRDEERVRMQANLGTKNRMILRNHGTLSLGPTVPEAFMRMYFLEMGCTAQVRAMAGTLHMPSAESRARTEDAGTNPRSKHLFVDLAWPALLRKLDRMDPSYRN